MATTLETGSSERLRELFITGLKNAHALEKQALSIMEPQIKRIEHYPEIEQRLREHVEETHRQIRRLDELLDDFGTSASTIKDMATSFAGTLGAIGHSIAGDEILKNSFANYAFENFEIASYKALIVMAEDGAFGNAAPALRETLREEQRMAEFIDKSLPLITRRYSELYVTEGSHEAKA